MERIFKAIQEFEKHSVLVLGDIMLDEYIYGDVERISPEAPVQIVDIKGKSHTLGGAGNVAKNLVELGAKVAICGVIGDDESGRIVKNELEERKIESEAVFVDPERPTTRKTRIIANSQQILRLDYESREEISDYLEKKIISYVLQNKESFDAIIISDYAKGVVKKEIVQKITKCVKEKLIVADPKGKDFSKYRCVTAITPNRKEATSVSGTENLEETAKRLLFDLRLKSIFITLGKEGIYVLEKGKDPVQIPSMAKEVYDVSGAGDTVISTICLSILSGLSCQEAAFLANIAAGVVVGKLGTATVSREEIVNNLLLERSRMFHKIVSPSELIQIVAHLKSQDKKIVFTNGCFDLLHIGHIHLLRESKKLGDVLIVAIDDDSSVKRIKGEGRPILNQYERAQIISALDCVDYVIMIEREKLKEVIEKIRPDFLTKGEDYLEKQIEEKEIAERYGGKFVFIPFLGKRSTSQIIERLRIQDSFNK